MNGSLTIEQVNALLVRDNPRLRYPVLAQVGPLRFFDKEMRCTNRNCGSPTYYKVDGIPMCNTHALIRLNGIIVGMTGE